MVTIKNMIFGFISAKDIGHIARLSEKQIQRYIQVLIRLELILAIKNPGQKVLNSNPGLYRLFIEKFKKLPNKPIYFFKVLSLSEEKIKEKSLKAKGINLWFENQYKTKQKGKIHRFNVERKRQLKAMEELYNIPRQA